MLKVKDTMMESDDEFAKLWGVAKEGLDSLLEFDVLVQAGSLKYADLKVHNSEIVCFLVDDMGIKYKPVEVKSRDPKLINAGDRYLVSTLNIVKFNRVSDGVPLITSSTKYLDLYIASPAGRVRFHFVMDDIDIRH
jgi:hypothetical protein